MTQKKHRKESSPREVSKDNHNLPAEKEKGDVISKEDILEVIPELEDSKEIVREFQMLAKFRRSALPPPEELHVFEQYHSGITKEMWEESKIESSHRRDMDKVDYRLAEKDQGKFYLLKLRQDWMIFVFVLVCSGFIYYLSYLGKTEDAKQMALFAGSAVAAFKAIPWIWNKISGDKQEKNKKGQ